MMARDGEVNDFQTLLVGLNVGIAHTMVCLSNFLLCIEFYILGL